jgi:hypothetical protein
LSSTFEVSSILAIDETKPQQRCKKIISKKLAKPKEFMDGGEGVEFFLYAYLLLFVWIGERNSFNLPV